MQHTNDNKLPHDSARLIDKAFDAPVKILTDLEIEYLLRGLELERKRITNHWEQI